MEHKCPTCDGHKETQAFVCGIGVGGLRTMPCDTCKAKGFLTEEEMIVLEQRKAKHQERRAARMELDLSQKEMAKRMGVSLVDYSSYEQGRIDL